MIAIRLSKGSFNEKFAWEERRELTYPPVLVPAIMSK
jgi:hypothetical protein